MKPEPVRPSLNALLAQRGAPVRVRYPLVEAVVARVRQHPSHRWHHYLKWALLRTTDLPRGDRMARTAGRVIEETPKQAAARQRQAAAANGTATPEQQELDARRAAKRTEADKARDRFLEESGFAAVLERAEVLVADLPRGLEEHRRAQAACAELTTFLELAREAPEDHTLGRFARRADDLLRSIQAEPLLVSNANALRGLIARVRSCNVDDVNGPVRNPNVTEAWRKQFMALLTGLPGQDYAAWCAKQVAALIAEARAARRGAS
jgi:hypothetical protein